MAILHRLADPGRDDRTSGRPARGVVLPRAHGYGWSGGFGTTWVTDPEEGLVAVLCTQVLSSTGSSAVEAAFWPAVYQALDS